MRSWILGVLLFVGTTVCVATWLVSSIPDPPSNTRVIDSKTFIYVTARKVEGEWLEIVNHTESPIVLKLKRDHDYLLIHADNCVTFTLD
jgi:hypothetical protein